jgi:hypothetical protein
MTYECWSCDAEAPSFDTLCPACRAAADVRAKASLVARLRKGPGYDQGDHYDLHNEAADEIERLRAALEAGR